MTDATQPLVGICMGSDSDLAVMQAAADVLREHAVPYEVRIISAHRTPDAALTYGRSAQERGLEVLIAGAGGAAHLPGVLAALTPLPVIGVPVPLRHLDGLDSLLSIVQMPRGTPVATVGVGAAANAGHLALRILGGLHPRLRTAVLEHQRREAERVAGIDVRVAAEHGTHGRS